MRLARTLDEGLTVVDGLLLTEDVGLEPRVDLVDDGRTEVRRGRPVDLFDVGLTDDDDCSGTNSLETETLGDGDGSLELDGASDDAGPSEVDGAADDAGPSEVDGAADTETSVVAGADDVGTSMDDPLTTLGAADAVLTGVTEGDPDEEALSVTLGIGAEEL